PLTKVCPRCAAVDFPRLLDWKPGQPRPWVQLSHVGPPPLPSIPPSIPPSPPPADSHPHPHPPPRALFPPGRPQCPFCLVFGAMIGPLPSDGLSKFNPYLRIRLAFERLDGIGEKHELARSVLMEVTAQKKSLPWGYLLRAEAHKADDDEEDRLSAHLTPKGQGAAIIRGRQVPPLLNPSLPRCWLDFCRQNHADSTCAAPPTMRRLPVAGFRLIDCKEKRVVAADEMEDPDSDDPVEYLALSYAWAQTGLDSSADDAPPSRLPSALRLGPDGHLPDQVAPLFADAIAFTATLGFRYLWIDRFCLQVNDPAARRRQIHAMDEIYSRSSLTLIVAAEDGVLTKGIAAAAVRLPEAAPLSRRNRRIVQAMVQASLPTPPPPSPGAEKSAADADAKHEFPLVGVLVSGRNWKAGFTSCQVTALICGRSGWDGHGPWVRLGAVAIDCECFAVAEGDGVAVMRGVEMDEDVSRDLRVRSRELDLY
ncbi:hypothetical protein E4U41_003340, partial [Claviceps citrina]